jgi:hypothetical protein
MDTFSQHDGPHVIPELDAYRHVRHWTRFLSLRYCSGKPLKPHYPLFPSCSHRTHDINWNSTLSTTSVNDLLAYYGRQAQLETDRLTSHCFQRGGLQYWFALAPVFRRWPLHQCQWWGGWAPGENVGLPPYISCPHFRGTHIVPAIHTPQVCNGYADNHRNELW